MGAHERSRYRHSQYTLRSHRPRSSPASHEQGLGVDRDCMRHDLVALRLSDDRLSCRARIDTSRAVRCRKDRWFRGGTNVPEHHTSIDETDVTLHVGSDDGRWDACLRAGDAYDFRRTGRLIGSLGTLHVPSRVRFSRIRTGCSRGFIIFIIIFTLSMMFVRIFRLDGSLR